AGARRHRSAHLCARRQERGLRNDVARIGPAFGRGLPSCRAGHRIRAGHAGQVMRKATVISAGLHAAVLLWATVSFSSRSMDATPTESLPIDIVTDSQFTQLTKGAKDAEKKPDLKPLVEKVAPEEKTADEVKPKVTPKQ